MIAIVIVTVIATVIVTVIVSDSDNDSDSDSDKDSDSDNDLPRISASAVRLGYSWGTGGVRWEIFGKPALTGSNWLYLTI